MTPAVRQILADSWRKGAGLRLDFANDRYFQQGVGSGIDLISVSRASTGTDLLPSSPSGASYLTFAANTPRRSALAGGLLVEEGRTQLSAFPTAPQNETITIGSTGTYTLWVNGAGSATVAAGTAVGSGFGSATNGTPVVFTISTTGTVGITVTGSLQALQVELGTWGTSFIPQAATTRAADVPTMRVQSVFGGAYTVYAAGTPLAPAGHSAAQFLVQIDDGTPNNRVFIQRIASTGNVRAQSISGAVGTDFTGGVWATGTFSKSIVSVSAGAQSALTTGGALLPGSGSLPVGVANVRTGTQSAGVVPWNGAIAEIAIWPSNALSDSDLQRMTTL